MVVWCSTVLGLLLYAFYINSQLTSRETTGQIISFADDTAMLYESNELKLKMGTNLTGIVDWFNLKLLKVNFVETFLNPFPTPVRTKKCFRFLRCATDCQIRRYWFSWKYK